MGTKEAACEAAFFVAAANETVRERTRP